MNNNELYTYIPNSLSLKNTIWHFINMLIPFSITLIKDYIVFIGSIFWQQNSYNTVLIKFWKGNHL